MHPNQKSIETFYSAFARLDADTMAGCYAPEAQFDDEVFSLRGQRDVAGMWRMLCEATQARGRDDWRLTYCGVHAGADMGEAHWDAHYRFSSTGRIVDNSIDARFAFDPQGRILTHRDSFDFWRWSRQALGTPGYLLGWTPQLRAKVRRRARVSLSRFLARAAA